MPSISAATRAGMPRAERSSARCTSVAGSSIDVERSSPRGAARRGNTSSNRCENGPWPRSCSSAAASASASASASMRCSAGQHVLHRAHAREQAHHDVRRAERSARSASARRPGNTSEVRPELAHAAQALHLARGEQRGRSRARASPSNGDQAVDWDRAGSWSSSDRVPPAPNARAWRTRPSRGTDYASAASETHRHHVLVPERDHRQLGAGCAARRGRRDARVRDRCWRARARARRRARQRVAPAVARPRAPGPGMRSLAKNQLSTCGSNTSGTCSSVSSKRPALEIGEQGGDLARAQRRPRCRRRAACWRWRARSRRTKRSLLVRRVSAAGACRRAGARPPREQRARRAGS